jgi:hypothetical protein
MRPGPLIMLILGIVLTLVGAVLTVGGAAVALAQSAQGRDGYFSSPTGQFAADSYAMVNRFDGPGSATPDQTGAGGTAVASIRLTAASTTGADVFIGIAPTATVDRYLAGVHHTEVRDVQAAPFRVDYLDVPGRNRPAPPTAQDFWVESDSGPGDRSITVAWQSGDYSVVVMNADADRPVAVDVRVGAHIGFLGAIATALLGVGIGTVLVGLVLLVLGIVGLARGSGPARPAQPVGAGAAAPPVGPERPRYPAG